MKYSIGDSVMIINEIIGSKNIKNYGLSLNTIYKVIDTDNEPYYNIYLLKKDCTWLREKHLISLTDVRINKLIHLLNINNT